MVHSVNGALHSIMAAINVKGGV